MAANDPAVRGDLPERFPASQRTLPCLVERQAAEHGDRPLAVFDTGTITFAGAPAHARRAAARLHAAGVGQGDRVAVMCPNRIEFLQVLLGAAWLGAVTVPINTASRGAQLEHILSNSGARVLVIDPELADRLGIVDLAAVPLERALLLDDGPGQRDPGPLDVGPLDAVPCSRWSSDPDVVDPGVVGSTEVNPGVANPVPVDADPGDVLAILYTSGTTGPSKGVCCPHAQYFWWGYHGVQILGITSGDVLLTTLPLFHTNALGAFYHALLTGSTLVIERRFSASGFLASLRERQATVTYLLGAMVPMLLSQPTGELDAAHRTRVALAPGVPATAKQEFSDRFGIGLVDGFGSTESNFVIAAPLDDQRPGTMGRVRPGFEARVVDEFEEDVPPDEPGELVLRATEPYAFSSGYYGMPAETVHAWRNLWLHTGDRVSRDADGYFRFIDRMKDAIRRRGENISSYEVEQVLAAHPAVAQVAVYPVRSELAEDEVMATIVPREGCSPDPGELLDHCQPRLSYFAVPRYIDFAESLPMTSNGKVQKFRLREAGITESAWDREQHGYVVRR